MVKGWVKGLLRLDAKRFVICVMMFSYAAAAGAYVSARLDTQLETDQSAYYSRHHIEEQVELNWLSDEGAMNAGLQFDLRYKATDYPDNRSDRQLRQMYFSQRSASIDYTLGRFNRSDMLGFYTLDGVHAKYAGNNWQANMHAGKPLQLEDYYVLDAGRIYGIDLRQQYHEIKNPIIKKTASYFGWQQLRKEETQNYLLWGFSGDGEATKGSDSAQALSVFFNGNYLLENNAAETINAGIQSGFKGVDLLRLNYNRWNPKQARLSFKQQFYSLYAHGRQSVAQAELFQTHRWNLQYYIRGRKVWREFGNDGYGFSAGFEKQAAVGKDINWQLQWDSLSLSRDAIHSLYLAGERSVSARLRTRLNTALQYKKNALQGNSKVVAVQFVVEQMLQSDLFIDFNARYIYDEKLEDEYRVGFRLSYRFDDRLRGIR